jgi:hypothetical protein
MPLSKKQNYNCHFLYKLLKLFSGTMVAAVLKFGGSLTPSDPQKNAVVIIGQPRYLSKINFSDVKMKLEPRVNEEVMYIDDTLQQSTIVPENNFSSLYRK